MATGRKVEMKTWVNDAGWRTFSCRCTTDSHVEFILSYSSAVSPDLVVFIAFSLNCLKGAQPKPSFYTIQAFMGRLKRT
jgi:hypothetical protein